MADKSEKAKLYKQIVDRADEYVLLERMRAYGFWSEHEPIPDEPPEQAKERLELEQEIAALREQHAASVDPQKALAEERRRRWEQSKLRRAQNKARRAEERAERRVAWEAFRKQALTHLGQGVSGGLQHKHSDVDALLRQGLPVMHDGLDVATLLGLPLSTLQWLTFHRRGATHVHYHRYTIPKKSGGQRAISAPKPQLKDAQRRVFEHILRKLSPEAEAHGFVVGRSILSNASPHVGKAVVVNLDLKDFFPTISFRRVKGLFKKLGYSEQVATVLALLCTEPPRVAAEHDGRRFHVALGQRVLPQGACTSPAITNLICRRLDRRVVGLARRHGFAYTRYADDLTLSGDRPRAVGRLLRSVRAILADEGFVENVDKTRVMRQGRRQEVTGVTVNSKPGLSRRELRRLRAVLHNVACHGLQSQNREGHADFAGHLRGKVAFACMLDPGRAPALREALARALERG